MIKIQFQTKGKKLGETKMVLSICSHIPQFPLRVYWISPTLSKQDHFKRNPVKRGVHQPILEQFRGPRKKGPSPWKVQGV